MALQLKRKTIPTSPYTFPRLNFLKKKKLNKKEKSERKWGEKCGEFSIWLYAAKCVSVVNLEKREPQRFL